MRRLRADMKARQPAIAFAALSQVLAQDRLDELRLLPAGQFRAGDGRPAGLAGWRLDAAGAAQIISRVAARTTRTVIDYEHQTLYAEKNGQPAPAAGWFSKLEWRDDGLYATDVQWTERAKQMIAAGEYRYISPVFPYDARTGQVLDLQMAGLTNHPGLGELGEIALRAAATYRIDHHEDPDMNETLQALLKALGLAEDATKDQAVAALKALTDQVTQKDTEIAALKAQVDPAKFVPIDAVTKLQEEIAVLKSQGIEREVNELVGAALADGRLPAVLEPWARDLGKRDLAALKAYVEKAVPIPALKGTQTGGKQPGETSETLSAEELAVCKQLGLTEAEFRKANPIAA